MCVILIWCRFSISRSSHMPIPQCQFCNMLFRHMNQLAIWWQPLSSPNLTQPYLVVVVWRTGLYGEPAYDETTVVNWRVANRCMTKVHLPCHFDLDLIQRSMPNMRRNALESQFFENTIENFSSQLEQIPNRFAPASQKMASWLWRLLFLSLLLHKKNETFT